MDGGLFNTQRSTDRRAAARPETTRHAAEESPRPSVEHVAHREPAPERGRKKQKSPKRGIVSLLVMVLLVVIIGLGAWFALTKLGNKGAIAVDGSKYQAVFFTNGQVYFGKLQAGGGDYLKLTDIYYLQSQASDTESSNPQNVSSDQQSNNVQLIKLGNEIHGPEDEMIINKDQVLFYENLKSDGKVAQTIAQAKENK